MIELIIIILICCVVGFFLLGKKKKPAPAKKNDMNDKISQLKEKIAVSNQTGGYKINAFGEIVSQEQGTGSPVAKDDNVCFLKEHQESIDGKK